MNLEIQRRQFPGSTLATAAPVTPARKGFAGAAGTPATRVVPAAARRLKINPAGGRMLEDSEAAGLWNRDYAPGCKPTF